MLSRLESELQQILLRIGDFLKTDIRYVVRQGSWLFGGEVINNILSIVLIVAFANLLSPTTYGTYRYILSIYGIFALFGLSGAGPAIIKSVAENNDGIWKPAIQTQMKWSLLGSLGSLLFALYYFYQGNDIFGYCFVIASIALPFFESQNTYQHILAGKKRFDLQIRYYSGTRIISALSLILTLLLTKNILIILAAYFFPYIIFNILFGYFAMEQIELNTNFDPDALRYMKHLSLISVISFTVNYLDGIIIFQFLGPIQLAIFSIASAPVSRLQSLFGIIPEISLPKYTERPIEEIKEAIIDKILKSIPICALIVGIYLVTVPIFFKIFLPQYSNAILFAQLLALPFIFYPVALFSRVMLAKGATQYIYKSNIVESTCQLLVMLFSVYYFGLAGAIVGRISMFFIGHYIIYYFFRKL